MAREELKWRNFTVDDFPPELVKAHNAVKKAEQDRNVLLAKALKKKGIMPEGTFLRVSVRGERYGVAFSETEQGNGGEHISLK